MLLVVKNQSKSHNFLKLLLFFCVSFCFFYYTSLSISFSTYSTVRTRFSPVSSMYSSVLLVIVSPKTFSLSLTVLLPGFVRTANFGKSALDGRSYKWGMQRIELVFEVKNWRSIESPVRFEIVSQTEWTLHVVYYSFCNNFSFTNNLKNST